jgi:hypothetical protein
VRAQLVPEFAADNELLDGDYPDWLSAEGRGTYTVRRS